MKLTKQQEAIRIHKNRSFENGNGWTMCHRGICFIRTNNWSKVTCKQCLKYRCVKVITLLRTGR